jgi:predicted metalloprotease with PDZ domain
MKLHRLFLPLLAACIAVPATAMAQEEPRRPGMIGIVFEERDGGPVRVVQVRPGFPAAEAGVREGDVLIALGGRPPAEHMRPGSPAMRAGDTVRVRISRDGVEREVAVIAVERPARTVFDPAVHEARRIVLQRERLEEPLRELTGRIDSLQRRILVDTVVFRQRVDSIVRRMEESAIALERLPQMRVTVREGIPVREHGTPAGRRPFLMELGRRAAAGAELAPMNEGLGRYFGGAREGVLVLEVGPGTPAERAGLEAGDVILRAGDEPVATPEDLRRRMSAASGTLPLQVLRQGRRHDLTLEWRQEPVRRRIGTQ